MAATYFPGPLINTSTKYQGCATPSELRKLVVHVCITECSDVVLVAAWLEIMALIPLVLVRPGAPTCTKEEFTKQAVSLSSLPCCLKLGQM